MVELGIDLEVNLSDGSEAMILSLVVMEKQIWERDPTK